MPLLSLLLPMLASAMVPNEAPVQLEATVLLESPGPLSVSPLRDGDRSTILLGGLLARTHEDEYRRLVNTGADPATLEGPERLHLAFAPDGATLDAAQVKTVLALKGYHVSDPSAFQPPGSERIYLFYGRGENRAAEGCRKKGESLRNCEEYLRSREIALATSEDGGFSWTQGELVVSARDKAKDGGDGTGGAMPAAVFTGGEIWLYYGTGKQVFTQENIYRLRLSADGTKRLAPPEPVRLAGFEVGQAFEHAQVVRLRCEEGNSSVQTLVANDRARSRIPMYLSTDGLRFKPASPSLVPAAGGAMIAPTQMPGPASKRECEADTVSGVETLRELTYSQELSPGRWQLKRARVKVRLP